MTGMWVHSDKLHEVRWVTHVVWVTLHEICALLELCWLQWVEWAVWITQIFESFTVMGQEICSSVLGQTRRKTLYYPSHCKEFCPFLFVHAWICWKYSHKGWSWRQRWSTSRLSSLLVLPADISIDAHQCLETVTVLMNTLLHDHNSAKCLHKGQDIQSSQPELVF